MDNKREVKEYLTALRARLAPEAAELTVFGGERRVPGLRREEVAQLAGISTAYYTRIERGDLSGVSESVLYALVRALQLNKAETAHLFDLAHVASGPRRRSRTRTAPRISERLALMMETMHDVPAISLTRLGDPAASNTLGRALFPHLFPEGRRPLNHTRYLFLDPRSQEFYPDWETSARETVSSLRLMAGQDPADRALMSLVGELSTHSNEFRTWWSGHTVRLHTSGTKRINHPVVGELTIGYDVLTIQATPDLKITTYLPEPGTPSADALDMLRSWVASQEQESRTQTGTVQAQKGRGTSR